MTLKISRLTVKRRDNSTGGKIYKDNNIMIKHIYEMINSEKRKEEKQISNK